MLELSRRHYCPIERRSEKWKPAAPKIVGPQDGKAGFLGSIGVRFMIDGDEAGDRFSLVEHPMAPRALAAPLHRHTREDEYSYVLQGRMGALLGDDVVYAEAGRPRPQAAQPVAHVLERGRRAVLRILEIISPAGFEHFFRGALGHGRRRSRRPARRSAALNERYGLEMQPDSVPGLLERFGLVIGEHLTGGWTP